MSEKPVGLHANLDTAPDAELEGLTLRLLGDTTPRPLTRKARVAFLREATPDTGYRALVRLRSKDRAVLCEAGAEVPADVLARSGVWLLRAGRIERIAREED